MAGVKVTLLGTGSKGNALVVECDGDRILIDAGFPARTLAKRLRGSGVAPESISALVLTHAHGDHATGARVAASRYGWTVYATPGTLRELPELHDLRPVPLSPRESLMLDTMVVSSVRIPHDCREPIAVLIESRETGATCAVAWDLGYVPASVERALRGADAIVLESNHDLDMLRHGPYPPSVQRRIAGSQGHLSNADAAGALRRVAHRALRHVVLSHLSEPNNSPSAARESAQQGLRGTAFRGSLTVASQHAATVFEVEGSRRVEQMSLF